MNIIFFNFLAWNNCRVCGMLLNLINQSDHDEKNQSLISC